MREKKKDIFVCHASADKAAIVRPLVALLEAAELSCWVDEAEIRWGHDIVATVNDGLARSQFVLVVLSPTFLGRPWPEKELNSALNVEAGSGEVRVLPLLAGTHEDQDKILAKYPLLAGKRYLRWPDDQHNVPKEIGTLLGRHAHDEDQHGKQIYARKAAIPIPRVRRAPSDRDRDRMVKSTFKATRAYFEAAVDSLKQSDAHVEADIDDVDSQKFVCRIYSDGDLVKQCKIWIGGLSGGGQISYSEGRAVDIRNDNSYNDWITVRRDELAWEGSAFGRGSTREAPLQTEEDAARYFWERFIQNL